MGSLLNLITFHQEDYNRFSDNTIQGPLYRYFNDANQQDYRGTVVFSKNKALDGYLNLIIVEPINGYEGFLDIPEYVFNFVNRNDCKLILSSLIDPSDYNTFKKYYNILISKVNDIDKIVFLDATITNRAGRVFNCNYIFEKYSRQTLPEIFPPKENELGYVPKPIELNELDGFRNKKFLSLNRGLMKYQRTFMLLEYFEQDYSSSYFSFLENIENNIPHIEYFIDKFKFKNSDIPNILAKLPIELDTLGSSNKMNFGNTTFKKELYLDSCINIVNETSFEDNNIFISEKIVKPILMYQPFILIGPAGYLKELKKYGFKTFSEFWDESYDDEFDSAKRILKIQKLIRMLNSKSIEELNEIYRKTKNICIYNRDNLVGKQFDSLNKIIKML